MPQYPPKIITVIIPYRKFQFFYYQRNKMPKINLKLTLITALLLTLLTTYFRLSGSGYISIVLTNHNHRYIPKLDDSSFHRLMRQYHADDVERHVIASHTDIGDVTQVKVKFVRGNDLHALGAAHDIQIRSVTVEPLEHPQQ